MNREGIAVAVAIGATVLAAAVVIQPVGCNQTSHYAAVQSYSRAHATIDRYAAETCDTAWWRGHFYSAKSPGLPLLTVPWYLLLRAAGADPKNPSLERGYPEAMLAVPRRAIWQLGLWGVVLPALVLLLLVRLVVERFVPGFGAPTAALIGLGTLLLPFSTLYFSHVLATCLAFGAFWLLLRGRPTLAGLAGGLAVVADYPLAVAVAALLLYARRDVLRFAAGTIAGLVPLALFNWWAFGTLWHLSYQNAVLVPGRTGHDVLGANRGGLFGVGTPDLRVALELLFTSKGLLVLSPVLLAALAGVWLLARARHKAEALLVGGLSLAMLVYTCGYRYPFGGWVPGPRFLIPLIPFLAPGLAMSLRRWPLQVGVLGAISIGAMAIATSAEPLIPGQDTRSWIDRIGHGDFARTVASLAGGGHGWGAITVFYALVFAAMVATALLLPLRFSLRDVAAAVTVALAWMLLEHGAPTLLRTDRLTGGAWGAVAVVVLVVTFGLALSRRVFLPLVPLLALGTVRFDRHTKWALLLGLLVLVAVLAWDPLARRLRHRAIPA